MFTCLFNSPNKHYLLELYQALHPEDGNICADDLTLLTIENTFANGIYNDFGFMINNHLNFLLSKKLLSAMQATNMMRVFPRGLPHSFVLSKNSTLISTVYTIPKSLQMLHTHITVSIIDRIVIRTSL